MGSSVDELAGVGVLVAIRVFGGGDATPVSQGLAAPHLEKEGPVAVLRGPPERDAEAEELDGMELAGIESHSEVAEELAERPLMADAVAEDVPAAFGQDAEKAGSLAPPVERPYSEPVDDKADGVRIRYPAEEALGVSLSLSNGHYEMHAELRVWVRYDCGILYTQQAIWSNKNPGSARTLV